MYAWIWRKLPFGLPGKLIGSVLIASAALSLLWFVVFPWTEPLLPFDDAQIGQDAGTPGDPGAPADGGQGDAPPGDGHELPYNTEEPGSPSTRPSR